MDALIKTNLILYWTYHLSGTFDRDFILYTVLSSLVESKLKVHPSAVTPPATSLGLLR